MGYRGYPCHSISNHGVMELHHPQTQVTRAIAEGDTIGREVEDNAKAVGQRWENAMEI